MGREGRVEVIAVVGKEEEGGGEERKGAPGERGGGY